jgi:alpha-galactosidase
MISNGLIYVAWLTLPLLVLLTPPTEPALARGASQEVSSAFQPVVTIEDSLIKFAMDSTGRAQVAVKQPGGREWVLAPADLPFFSLHTQGGKHLEIQLDWSHSREEALQNEIGKGTRKRIPGVARADSSRLELELFLDHYDDAPGWVMTQLRLRVPASAVKPVEVGTVEIASLRLVAPPAGQTYWSFQGAGDVREHYVRPVPAGFHKENFLGVIEPGYGGGIPVVDLWQPGGGLALGHLELQHQELALPIAARADGSVDMLIHQEVRRAFRPGATWSSPYEFVAVHHGDFYAPLRMYGGLMARRGLPRPQSPPDAYEPYWTTWGYGYDFRLADIREKLPLLKTLGIPWIVIDDRWFDAAGDWEPRRDIYPRGEEDFRAMVDELHRAGFKVQLWIVPSEVDAGLDLEAWKAAHPQLKNLSHFIPSAVRRAKLLDAHPDWIILDEHGNPPLSKRGYYYLCPALPDVQNYFRASVEKWFRQWGVDGLKQDAVYICPPCYNPKHHHASPEDAPQAYAAVQKIILETARAAKPHCVIYSCPCGVAPEYTWLPWLNQLVTADAEGPDQVRSRTKALRALAGDRVAIFSDFVEMGDFSSALGVGDVLETEFTSFTQEKKLVHYIESFPAERAALMQETKVDFEKWFGLYRQLQLSHATYLNLYDIAFDHPEAHVLRKGEKLYYAFYTPQPQDNFRGPVEFRGLGRGTYRAYDYYHAQDLGTVTAQSPQLSVVFRGFLLVELSPAGSASPPAH